MCELQSFSAARYFELVWLKVILRLGLTVKFSLTTSDIAYNLFHVGCRGCYGELIYLYPLTQQVAVKLPHSGEKTSDRGYVL